jgi:hypothetical protein
MLRVGAEVFAVLDQAALAAAHGEDEFADLGIGDRFEAGAQAAGLGRVDAADEVDMDLAVQRGDKVGQLVAGGAEEDWAFGARRAPAARHHDRQRGGSAGGARTALHLHHQQSVVSAAA